MRVLSPFIPSRSAAAWVICIAHSIAFGQTTAPVDEERTPQDAPPGRVAVKLIVLKAEDASDDDLGKMVAALGAVKDVLRAAIHPPDNYISILATTNSAVTVERAVRYLDLAGYSAKEAGDETYAKVEAALRSGVIDFPASSPALCASPPPSTTTAPASRLNSLAGSVEPLRESFNASRGRPRFLALLSPT